MALPLHLHALGEVRIPGFEADVAQRARVELRLDLAIGARLLCALELC
jgi:hypothetical protein